MQQIINGFLEERITLSITYNKRAIQFVDAQCPIEIFLGLQYFKPTIHKVLTTIWHDADTSSQIAWYMERALTGNYSLSYM